MTTDLWVRIRRLLHKRTPARKLEHALAGYRPDEPLNKSVLKRKRERLDLMRGWVPESLEDAPKKISDQKGLRRASHHRNGTR